MGEARVTRIGHGLARPAHPPSQDVFRANEGQQWCKDLVHDGQSVIQIILPVSRSQKIVRNMADEGSRSGSAGGGGPGGLLTAAAAGAVVAGLAYWTWHGRR